MCRGALRDACLVGMRFSIRAWTLANVNKQRHRRAVRLHTHTSEPWSCGIPHAKSRLACREIAFARKCSGRNPMKVKFRDPDDPIWLEVNNVRRILEPIGERLCWFNKGSWNQQKCANFDQRIPVIRGHSQWENREQSRDDFVLLIGGRL
jgi:hypothetical protein